MGPCAICGISPSDVIEVRAASGPAQAVLCGPCYDGVVWDAALRTNSCRGCQALVGASERASRADAGHLSVVVPSVPTHAGDCVSVGSRLLRTAPKPFAAWSQRRAWLMRAKMLKERFFGAAPMHPLLSAYRDEWLVGWVGAKSTSSREARFAALVEASALAASLGATQVRVLIDLFTLGAPKDTLPEISLLEDPRARPALMALDWDGVRRTTTLELRCYSVDDHGNVAFDDDPLPMPQGADVLGEVPELVQRITDEPHPYAPVQYSRWMTTQGYGVHIDPLPSSLARDPIRIGAAHRQEPLRAVLARFRIDPFCLPEPHRILFVIPIGGALHSQWYILGMYSSLDQALEVLRSHPAPPRGLLVDLDGPNTPIRAVTADDQHHRAEIGEPCPLESCTADRLTTIFSRGSSRTQPDPLENEPPDLPGPDL